jgi:uncharacterized protein
MRPARSQLFRWAGWFFLINSVLSFITQLSYLHMLPNLSAVYGATTGRIWLAWVFMFASYITQAVTINFFSCLIALIFMAIFPRYWLGAAIAVILSTVFGVGQIVDVVTFKLFHTHNITMAWTVYKAGAFAQVLPLSAAELALMISLFCGFLVAESLLALVVWHRIKKGRHGHFGKRLAGAIILLFLFSYAMMASILTFPPNHRLNPENSRLLLKVARFVPYFTDVYSRLIPYSEVNVRRVNTKDGLMRIQTRQVNKPLHYPTHPLVCHAPKKPMNIVFLIIDTWRYDAMNKTDSPFISQFAKKTLQFKDDWSGGNCTQPGVFSMFYGIPGNYWKAALDQHVGPVFINKLKQEGYQLGIYGSATLKFPEFEKTVFQNVPHLQTETKGSGSIGRDKTITDQFAGFLKTRNAHKPFFSFLFYDSAHNYCGGGGSAHQTPFSPAVKYCERYSLTTHTDPRPYVNRYHNAVYYIDGLVKRDIAALKKHGLLKNTIVVITADHGEEFDDEHLNYWSHASAYTPFQLHVPLLIWWPGRTRKTYDYFTTHYDLAPTLMHQVLGCPAPSKANTVGHSLFSAQKRPFFLSSSYGDYAVVQKNKVVRVFPGGDYVINNPNGHHKRHGQLNPLVMEKAYKQLNYYFTH